MVCKEYLGAIPGQVVLADPKSYNKWECMFNVVALNGMDKGEGHSPLSSVFDF